MTPVEIKKISESDLRQFSNLFESLWQADSFDELQAYFVEASRRFFPLRAAAILRPTGRESVRVLGRSGRFSFSLKELAPVLPTVFEKNRPVWPEEVGELKDSGLEKIRVGLIPLAPDLIFCFQCREKRVPDWAKRQLLLHGVALFRGVHAHLETQAEQKKRLSELNILNRVSGMLNQSLSLEEFFDRLYGEVKSLFPCETHFLCTFDEKRQLITLELFVDAGIVVRKKVFRLEELGFLRYVIENKVPLLIPDMEAHLRNQGVRPVLFGRRKNSKSWAGIPLLDGDRILGVIAFASYTRKIDWEAHLSFLQSLGQIVTSALRHLQDREKLAVSQEKYRTLFQELPTPAALVGSDGRIVETNLAFDRQIRPLVAGNGKSILHLISSRENRRQLTKALKAAEPFRQTIRLKRRPGADHYFQLTARPFSFGNDLPRNTLIILDDQTQTFRRQELLFSLYKMTFEIQQARTRHKILKTAVDSLKRLGFHSFVLMYQPEEKAFILNPHSFSVRDISFFPFAQKLGFTDKNDVIKIGADTFQALKKSVQSLEMIFREDAQAYLRENYPEEIVQGILPGFRKLGVKSTLAVPIHFRESVLGTLVVLGEFTSRDEFAIFQNLATAMAIALDRAQALKQLELSQRKYQTTLEKAGMALWVTDAEGIIQEMNKAARKLLGKESGRWVGRSISALWDHPIHWQRDLAGRQNAEKRFGEVGLIVEKDKVVPVFLIASCFRIEKNTFIEWIAWDLRKQKRREDEIARRTKELETLYRVGLQINRSHNIRQLFKNVVTEILSLFNMDASGIYMLCGSEKLCLEFELGTPPEYNREIRTLQVGEGLAGWIAENRLPLLVTDIREDGRVTREVVLKAGFVSYAGVPILYGKKLLGTLGLLSRAQRVFSDNEMKLLQTVANELAIAIENVRLNERLEEASRRYRHLFHEAADGMVLVDFERFQIAEANRYISNKFHVHPEQLVGRPLLDFVLEADRPRVVDYLQALPVQRGRQNLRVRFLGGEKKIFSADVVGGVLRLASQPFAMLMIRDVTRQIELEEQLRLNQQLAAVGELSAGIAHEIRNPLSAINTSVGMLQSVAELSGDDQELLRIISEESRRLEKVVSEFIQFARPQKPVFEKLRFSRLVSDIIRIFQSSGDGTVQIVFEKKRDPGAFWFDGNMIRQIVVNLVKNALDAISNAGVENGEIFISLDRREVNAQYFAELVVRDNGPGVPSEKQSQIFQPFFSTKPDGLGMGLSISRKIVEQHGGQLFLEPGRSGGAEFHLLLPLKRV